MHFRSLPGLSVVFRWHDMTCYPGLCTRPSECAFIDLYVIDCCDKPFFADPVALLSQVFWLKDADPINVHQEINFIISNEGNLIINQARLRDMGNYTCGAQNVASRRLSESATLTVYGKET